MESAYLKNAVGTVLAKAVAETVVAQPSNPQEFLALYLLHHLQTEERKQSEASFKRKADNLREEWSHRRALQEKAAVDTIQRGFKKFKEALERKKAREAGLKAAYEEAEEEAEDLLEQEAAVREVQESHGRRGKEATDEGEEEGGEGNADHNALEEQEETFDEARAAFYRAQRFMLSLQKSHLGDLKNYLLDRKERVRVEQDATQALRDRVAREEESILDVEYDPQHRQPHLSAAAVALAERVKEQRDHSRVSMPLMAYRVLRVLCYLLFNSTPSATDTPAKVAALVKPTVAVQLLRAFDPCATYDRAEPLRLEKSLPGSENGEGDGDGDEHNGDAFDEGAESVPMSQPKTRQVRRARRVLRAALLDCEYLCELNPADFIDEDLIEEKEDLKGEVAQAEAAHERIKAIRETVEEQTKTRGGIVLWALLRFFESAVAYRTARDTLVAMRRDAGLDAPEGTEMPEEEEDDNQNEEVLVDEEGEVDHAAVRQLLARIGVDVDESLVNMWEAKDARRKSVLEDCAEAFRKAAEEDEEDDEGDEEDQ